MSNRNLHYSSLVENIKKFCYNKYKEIKKGLILWNYFVIYGSLHGIRICFVDDFSSLELAVEACREAGEYLVDSFFSPADEDEESFREGIEYNIYKIKDEVDLTTDQLDYLCYVWSRKSFIEKYCDKTPLI